MTLWSTFTMLLFAVCMGWLAAEATRPAGPRTWPLIAALIATLASAILAGGGV